MAKESEKLDIDDIKDPLDEVDNKDVDLEEAVEEEPEAKEESSHEKALESEESTEEEAPDELEKAVAEPKGEEEPKAEEKKKEEKPGKVKKPLPWKKIAIIFIAILALAAFVMGGVFLYQKYNKPKEETKTETPAAADTTQIKTETPTATQKTVYVTASDGLNLRKEPSVSAEKLTVIPFGTKLDVLATQGTWYQVTYNNLTGWIDGTYAGTDNPLVYKDTTYKFEITFPSDWAGYKLFPIAADSTATAAWYLGLPTTDTTYTSGGVDKGYASMAAVTVFTPAQWAAAQAEEGPKPTLAVQNAQWVIAYSTPNGIMAKDLTKQAAETGAMVKTIKFY